MERPTTPGKRPSGSRGFTLIELLIVLAIIGVLAGIAVPAYQTSIIKAREAALKEDLFQMREAIDKHYADKGEYPETLQALAEAKYIRAIPVDPVTESKDTWIEVPAEEEQGIFDVKSGSDKTARDGTLYSDW